MKKRRRDVTIGRRQQILRQATRVVGQDDQRQQLAREQGHDVVSLWPTNCAERCPGCVKDDLQTVPSRRININHHRQQQQQTVTSEQHVVVVRRATSGNGVA